jgi:hypothetical protein
MDSSRTVEEQKRLFEKIGLSNREEERQSKIETAR